MILLASATRPNSLVSVILAAKFLATSTTFEAALAWSPNEFTMVRVVFRMVALNLSDALLWIAKSEGILVFHVRFYRVPDAALKLDLAGI